MYDDEQVQVSLSSLLGSTTMLSFEELLPLCKPVESSQVYFRPFLCRRYDESILAQAWIIGANPATQITKSDISLHDYVGKLSHYTSFNDFYEDLRENRGKKRESPTRKYIREFEEWLLPLTSANFVETNVNAFPTPRTKDLHSDNVSHEAVQRGREIFVDLLLRFQPNMLIIHGNEAQKALKGIIKAQTGMSILTAQLYDPWIGRSDVQLLEYHSGRRGVVFPVPHFSRYRHRPREFEKLMTFIRMAAIRLPTSRHSWPNIQPIPVQHEQLDYSFSVRDDDMKCLRYGFYPTDMVEKWFVYTEDNVVYFHRSWSGYCVFQIRFEFDGAAYRAAEVIVNRDPEQIEVETSDLIALVRQAFEGIFQIYI